MKSTNRSIALATVAVVATGCATSLESGSDHSASSDPSGTATAAEQGTCEPGDAPLEGASITVATKKFDEQYLLGHITRLLLEDAGVDATAEINLGGINVVREAQLNGEVDAIWDYTGSAWASYFAEEERIVDRQEQFEAVKQRDAENNGICWLDPAGFNNTYGIAYRSEAAEELGNPQTLSDLEGVIEERPDAATFCVESEFAVRNDGLSGMQEAYGLSLPDDNVTEMDTGLVYQATDNGDPCNFGEIFTTDGRIAALDLTVLEDDLNYFPLYSGAPVVTDEVYGTYGQELDELLAPVADLLTQEQMTELNKRVSSDNERPEAVAQDFLESHDLIA